MPLRMSGPRPYQVAVDGKGGRFSLDEEFWSEDPLGHSGETEVDLNIETFLGELRVSLYWISNQRKILH